MPATQAAELGVINSLEGQRSTEANNPASHNGLTFLYLTGHQGIRLRAHRRGDARDRSRRQGPRCGRRTYSSSAMVLPSAAVVLPLPMARGRRRGQGGRCGRRAYSSPPAMVLPLPSTPASPIAATAWHKVRCPSMCLPSYRGVGEWGLQLH